jgi:pyridoxine 5-phosphate synthase
MPRLHVNVDHVATVRQARRASEPDPAAAAALAEIAGATGITIHLREDRRHIQDRDLAVLRETVKTRLNLEMAATDEMVAIALRHRPEQVTLVPEKRQELTTEGGLDAAGHEARLAPLVARLMEAGIEVSLFIAPDVSQIDAAQRLHAHAIELHTGAYAEAAPGPARAVELDKIRSAVSHGRNKGLVVHAGHGLDYRNVGDIAAIPGIDELNIGFSIVARAVLVGFERAVADMVAAIERGGTKILDGGSDRQGGRWR